MGRISMNRTALPPHEDDSGRWLSVAEAARRLGLRPPTLYMYRTHGKGPRGYKLPGSTAVRYWSADVDRWAMGLAEDTGA